MSVPIVFLSHSARDAAAVGVLKEILNRATGGRIEWWLSSDGQSIPYGTNWRAEVEQALRNCTHLFCLLTPRSRNSAWVQFEAGFAAALDKKITPVGMPGCDVGDAPGPLQSMQGFNLHDHGALNNFLQIINRECEQTHLLKLGEPEFQKFMLANGDSGDFEGMMERYFEDAALYGTIESPRFESMPEIAGATFLVPANQEEVEKDYRRYRGAGYRLDLYYSQSTVQAFDCGEGPPETLEYVLKGEIAPAAILNGIATTNTICQIAEHHREVVIRLHLRRTYFSVIGPHLVMARLAGTDVQWNSRGNGILFRGLSVGSYLEDLREDPVASQPPVIRYRLRIGWTQLCNTIDLADLLKLLIERGVIYERTED